MDLFAKKRLQLLFAASTVAGGVVGVAPGASAAICSCLPLLNTVAISAGAFKWLGTGTYGYDVNLTNDTLYGFRSTTAPVVWADFSSSMAQTLFANVCRFPFSGAARVCGPDTVINTPSSTTSYDVSVNPAGVHNPLNNHWDYYKLNIRSNMTNGTISPTGIGLQIPRCW
jgi:hypothetical protein